MTEVKATITFGEQDLGSVQIGYICETCNEEVFVDPSFFEVAGTPICGNNECPDEGSDMVAFVAHVTIETSS